MDIVIGYIQSLFKATPEIALFLCLALGYRLGRVSFGKFQLGGVAGSLLVAVVVSQFGVATDAGLKNVLFALFIYAVGYESGPQFFKSLNRKSLREIILAACLAGTGLMTVVVLARLFGLDKGLAAGVAAGGLTQSAIIGTAGDALAKMGLAAEQVKALQQNVAIGYAVTYVFGSFGAIIICVNILPRFMGSSIRDDAIKAELELHSGAGLLQPDQEMAVRRIVGRTYVLADGVDKTVAEIEAASGTYPITVERIKRGKRTLPATPGARLAAGDVVLLVGRGDAVLKAAAGIGKEVEGVEDMELRMRKAEVLVTREEFDGKPFGEIAKMVSAAQRRGIFILSLVRDGNPMEVTWETVVKKGDVLTLYGSDQDVARAAANIGYPLVQSNKTDFVYMGLGLVVGLLIGLVEVKIAGLPITLGSGGGALLSGLLFGWFRTRRPDWGNMPTGAVQLLKDLGLAGFVTIIGLSSGLSAVETIKSHGVSIFVIGALVTVIPLLLTMLIGRYILRYDNAAVLAGALSGARSANPAFGEVLGKAGNSVPTVPFAITYALANVFLTLLGPLVVILA